MLQKHRVAAISLLSFVSASVLVSPFALADLRPIPTRVPLSGRNSPQLAQATISGKVYLPASPALVSSASCTNIGVSLQALVKNPSVGSSSGGLEPQYIYKQVASVNASGDIKRGYCDYTLTLTAPGSRKYFLGASAKYDALWGKPPSSYGISGDPIGSWSNPFSFASDLELKRDMKLSVSTIR